MSTGPAELGVHLRKQNLADVHLLYPNRVGADLAIPLLFVPPPRPFFDFTPALPIYGPGNKVELNVFVVCNYEYRFRKIPVLLPLGKDCSLGLPLMNAKFSSSKVL